MGLESKGRLTSGSGGAIDQSLTELDSLLFELNLWPCMKVDPLRLAFGKSQMLPNFFKKLLHEEVALGGSKLLRFDKVLEERESRRFSGTSCWLLCRSPPLPTSSTWFQR